MRECLLFFQFEFHLCARCEHRELLSELQALLQHAFGGELRPWTPKRTGCAPLAQGCYSCGVESRWHRPQEVVGGLYGPPFKEHGVCAIYGTYSEASVWPWVAMALLKWRPPTGEAGRWLEFWGMAFDHRQAGLNQAKVQGGIFLPSCLGLGASGCFQHIQPVIQSKTC